MSQYNCIIVFILKIIYVEEYAYTHFADIIYYYIRLIKIVILTFAIRLTLYFILFNDNVLLNFSLLFKLFRIKVSDYAIFCYLHIHLHQTFINDHHGILYNKFKQTLKY